MPSRLIFSRKEKLQEICDERCGGDLGALMARLRGVEDDWFDDLNMVEDYLSSQDAHSPPRLPSRRSTCPMERYISNWAHYQKASRENEDEFMEVEKLRDAWDCLVEAYPFAFNW